MYRIPSIQWLSNNCKVALIASLVVLLNACVSTRWDTQEPQVRKPAPVSTNMTRTKRGNPVFYEEFGERYTVMPASEGYRERGIASWYGKKFHGRLTSSGEPYDMYQMTAAHKTLPLPTNVRVVNLENGRSIVVRVNDRGPFVAGRIIDLSYAAAKELGIIRKGTARVEVIALDHNGNSSAPTANAAATIAATNTVATPLPVSSRPAPPKLYAQLGAFGEQPNAERFANNLQGAGINNVRILSANSDGNDLFKVQVGPFDSIGRYDAMVTRLAELQIDNPRLVVDDELTAIND